MEHLLISFDEKSYLSKISGLEDFIQRFNNCIAIYNSFGLDQFKNNEFSDLFLHTENYVFEKTIQGKSLSLNGLPISKSKLFELVDKPKGYFSLTKGIEEMQ